MPLAYVETLLTNFVRRLREENLSSVYVHPQFGPLADKEAVSLPSTGIYPPVKRENPLLIHLTVTGRCNARCQGCINTTLTCQDRAEVLKVFETEPERDARAILQLIHQTRAPAVTLAFYGGEPFLALEKMEAIVSRLEELSTVPLRYMVYTNGQLIDRAVARDSSLLSKIWLLSVSIDGRPAQHARFRRGTDLETIRQNLRLFRSRSRALLLQWSTLREGQSLWDCFEEFIFLYEQGLADFFFWHLAETDEPFKDFLSFARQYHRDLQKILAVYLTYLAKGVLLPIVPLNDLLIFWLTGARRGHSACGVELATNFDLVGGKILACADLPPELALGDVLPSGEIRLNGQELLRRLVAYREVLGCEQCGVFAYCGGRCPVQVLTGSVERTLSYCQLTRLFVATVAEEMPAIERAFSRLGLTPQKLYDHSAFLAYYTDVIP